MKQVIKDMEPFGLYEASIDSDGYVTLYHGGKKLPKRLRKNEIFFMTPYFEEAQDYAKMRGGEVFTLKVNTEDVYWNQGSYEVEYSTGGFIEDGIIRPYKKANSLKDIVKGVSLATDPWGQEQFRLLREYLAATVGKKLPKSRSRY